MAITEADFATATLRATRLRNEFPPATGVTFDAEAMTVTVGFENNTTFGFAVRDVQDLQAATPDQLQHAEITAAGMGLYFPELDVDLYLPGLVMGAFGTARWMAAQNGKLGGGVRSDAKANASRENGKLGGRPKKAA